MKKLKSIFAICAVAAIIASCEKPKTPCPTVCQNGGIVKTNCGCDCPSGFTGANCETPIPPPICNITCQNGGAVNYANCNCDCPPGFSGSNCQTVDPPPCTAINVSINSSIYHQLPPIRYAGDNEFGGHSTMSWSAELTLSSDKTKIYAVVNAYFTELGGDTKAKVDGNLSSNRILLYTAPAGKKVCTINSATYYSDAFTPNYNTYILYTTYAWVNFVNKIEILGDTSGDDLPSDGSIDRSRFRIWFDDFNISIADL